MSTLVCCELAGGRGPREGLRLALNRSLSEPGPPDLPRRPPPRRPTSRHATNAGGRTSPARRCRRGAASNPGAPPQPQQQPSLPLP